MTNQILPRTIIISLLGHLAFFSIFNLSFGQKISPMNYVSVSFWGQVLYNSQFSLNQPKETKQSPLLKIPDTSTLNKIKEEPFLSARYYLKPSLAVAFNTEKGAFRGKNAPLSFPLKRKEPQIIFHPLLPYSFTLYFKDRQVAHVELMFKLSSGSLHKSIEIKRRLSSGNLEVDLLSARYIGHYLFIQQARFALNRWQSVKIDLSEATTYGTE